MTHGLLLQQNIGFVRGRFAHEGSLFVAAGDHAHATAFGGGKRQRQPQRKLIVAVETPIGKVLAPAQMELRFWLRDDISNIVERNIRTKDRLDGMICRPFISGHRASDSQVAAIFATPVLSHKMTAITASSSIVMACGWPRFNPQAVRGLRAGC